MGDVREGWAGRESRLGGQGVLLHADLHNHTALSDGRGTPAEALAALLAAGLDVAALTDHAALDPAVAPTAADYPDAAALRVARSGPVSLTEQTWALTAAAVAAADDPGRFTAVRGFEWTEPWLGHANVWFSPHFTPVTTPGRVAGLHDFLASPASSGALFGYNHPGREPGRFNQFVLAPHLSDRMVGLEMFNRVDDYLFEGATAGRGSPLVACLDAGWTPGLVGVSDEHDGRFGLVGKGRTGIWAAQNTAAAVREALLARTVFATREAGLRLDATIAGQRMGGALVRGVVPLAVDVDAGPARTGQPVSVQLLTSGGGGQVGVLAELEARLGHVLTADVTVPTDAAWVVVRVADPARRSSIGAPAGHPGTRYALAYASPWYAALPLGQA